MKFENEFEVKAPVEEVWKAMLDVERVAPCVPGAEVLEQTGENSYKVAIKVKLGPVSMLYRGDVDIVETDEDARRATLRARAKEARGQGTADATTAMHLEERDGGTHATLETDVRLSGRAAAMGGRMIGDVSAKLVDTFATNLAAMLEGEGEGAAAASAHGATTGAPAEGAAGAGDAKAAASGNGGTSGGRAPAGDAGASGGAPEAEFDALSFGAEMAADRLRDPKVLAAVVGGAFLLGVLVGRRGR